jgi:hypothetical protein
MESNFMIFHKPEQFSAEQLHIVEALEKWEQFHPKSFVDLVKAVEDLGGGTLYCDVCENPLQREACNHVRECVTCKRKEPWIPISSKFAKPGIGQLCTVVGNGVVQLMAAAWTGEKFVWADGYIYGESAFDELPSELISHWRPLPEFKE